MANASAQAHSQLQEAIMSGEIAEGARIREDEWAQRLGISRTPVREALRRLSAEGLVELFPARGARVLIWATDDLEDLFRLRALVESYAAELAAASTDDDVLQPLLELHERMEKLARSFDEDSRRELGRLDVELHQGIVGLSGSKRLIDTHDRLMTVPTAYRTIPALSKQLLRDRLKQHNEVLQAIRLGKEDWAAAAMRAHVLSGWQIMLEQRQDHADSDSMQSASTGR